MTDKIDMERLRLKRGPGRPRQAEVMPQISIRVPQWMLDNIDAVIEHDRHGQGDRATIIREAIAAYLVIWTKAESNRLSRLSTTVAEK